MFCFVFLYSCVTLCPSLFFCFLLIGCVENLEMLMSLSLGFFGVFLLSFFCFVLFLPAVTLLPVTFHSELIPLPFHTRVIASSWMLE